MTKINLSLFNRLSKSDISIQNCIHSRISNILSDRSSYELDQIHNFEHIGEHIGDLNDLKINIHDKDFVKKIILFYKSKILYYECRLKDVDIQISKDGKSLLISCIAKDNQTFVFDYFL